MPADDLEEKLLVVFHVGRLDAQEIVETTRDVVALCHFGHLPHHIGECFGKFGAESSQFHTTEHRETLVEFGCVEDCGVLLDIAQSLQTFHSFECGGGG